MKVKWGAVNHQPWLQESRTIPQQMRKPRLFHRSAFGTGKFKLVGPHQCDEKHKEQVVPAGWMGSSDSETEDEMLP